MKIIETNIPNVVQENIDHSKVVLAENIIKNVYPLFDEVYISKKQEINKFKKTLDDKKKIVNVQKNNLEQLVTEYKRQKKVTKLIDRIEKLITSGLVYDGAMKHEIIVLLKVIDKLSDEKLDFHLKETMKIISKRFSQ